MAEALELGARLGDDASWYAGGTELLQVMKLGFARFGTLIDLKGIDDLRGIAFDDDGRLIIGGATTHREIERSPVVGAELPALATLETQLANVRVRNHGTIGGNLCFAEPHSDPATLLLACGARVRLRGPAGVRELAIDELIVGPFETSRRPDELLVAVVVPARRPGEGRAYTKARFRERPAASVGVRVRVDGGAVVEATVAVGSITEQPVRVADAEAALVGVPTDFGAGDGEALANALRAARPALGALDAVDDLDGSADYKRHLASVLLGRAVPAAIAEAASA